MYTFACRCRARPCDRGRSYAPGCTICALAAGEILKLIHLRIQKVGVRAAPLILCMFGAACGSQGFSGSVARTPEPVAQTSVYSARSKGDFSRVASRVEAATKSVCAERSGPNRLGSCDFTFVLARDPMAPPNAFQSMSGDGRPLITVTSSLLAQLRDDNELATVLSHEAAHHVAGHIARINDRASLDAFLLGDADWKGGVSVRGKTGYTAQSAGMAHARALELEADWIGAFIDERAGYEPEKGADIYRRAMAKQRGAASRTSSHPDPSQRLEVISAAVMEIRRQRSAGLTPGPENAPAPLP
jgi:Zn-dependent protease with chaperone function